MVLNNVSIATPLLNPLLNIVPIYAAIFGLMLVYLSALVIKQRHKAKVSLGDGDDPALRKAIAMQATFHNMCHLRCCSSCLLS